MSIGTAIVITSGKGGTGKTSTAAGVAACLAAMGHRTLCLDGDIGLRNLDLVLGMTDQALMDFTDVVQGRCSLERAVVEHPDIQGLYLLTAPLVLPEPDIQSFRQLMAEAREYFDYIFMDSPAGLGDGFQLAMAAADRVIVVSATDPAALRDAQRTVAELLPQVSEIHLVMNRVQPKLIRKLRTSIDEAMDTAGLPLLGIVPEDKQVMLAAGQGLPLVLYAHKDAARAYLNIAKRLMGAKVPLLRIH